ncbi:hypothetical protein CRUP_007769 [Coryphaenoides rupestris]|nr:hypothetical protein CRUP_007769 [Coryphaenoides rupestris]
MMLTVDILALFTCNSTLACYAESELEERALKRLKNHDLSLPERTTASDVRCPVGEFAALGEDVKDRSISPWRLVYDTDNDRYPHTLAVAQCLCGGCITIKSGDISGGTEDFTYNSRQVNQSRTVLRKELCDKPVDGKTHRLVWSTVSVAVACTCVKPKY